MGEQTMVDQPTPEQSPSPAAEAAPFQDRMQRLGQRLGDLVNPIAVKEMRQAVSGKLISGVLILFLIVQTAVVPIYTLTAGTSADALGDGSTLFMILLAILLGTCLLFVPASTAQRLVSERSEQNVDLMFITTLRPWRIISGKFFSAMVLTLLIYALCMPYMTLAYLMRGIDLPTIFTILGANLVVIAWCVMLATFLASMPMARFVRMTVQVASLGVFIGVFVWSLSMAGMSIQGGMGMFMTGSDWLAMLAFFAGTGLLMFTLAVAAISPASSNRAVLPRACFMLVWLGTAAAFMAAGGDAMVTWGWLAVTGLSLALMAAIGERHYLNRRLAAKVPRNPLLRLPAFFFFSGAANGIAWTAALMLLTLALIWSMAATGSGPVGGSTFYAPGISTEIAQRMEIFATYALAYALAGFLVARFTPLSRWIAPAHTFVIALVLVALGAVFPLIAAVMTGTMHVDQIAPGWWLTSIGTAFTTQPFVEEAVWVGRVAALGMLVAVSPWWLRRLAAFRPPHAAAETSPGSEGPTGAADGNGDGAVERPAVTEEFRGG